MVQIITHEVKQIQTPLPLPLPLPLILHALPPRLLRIVAIEMIKMAER